MASEALLTLRSPAPPQLPPPHPSHTLGIPITVSQEAGDTRAQISVPLSCTSSPGGPGQVLKPL